MADGLLSEPTEDDSTPNGYLGEVAEGSEQQNASGDLWRRTPKRNKHGGYAGLHDSDATRCYRNQQQQSIDDVTGRDDADRQPGVDCVETQFEQHQLQYGVPEGTCCHRQPLPTYELGRLAGQGRNGA